MRDVGMGARGTFGCRVLRAHRCMGRMVALGSGVWIAQGARGMVHGCMDVHIGVVWGFMPGSGKNMGGTGTSKGDVVGRPRCWGVVWVHVHWAGR